MSRRTPSEPEEPRGPIEIIPPGEERTSSRIWISTGSRQFKIVRLGPIGSTLLALALIILSAIAFVFLTGLFLIIVPVLVAFAIVAYLFGGPMFRRLR